jgi:hypothetical protein
MAAGKMNRKQRKELARRMQSASPGLEVVHPRAAGIDVGNTAHYVAVRPERDAEPVRALVIHNFAYGFSSAPGRFFDCEQATPPS